MNLTTIIKQNPVASFIALTLGLSFAAFLLPVPQASAFALVAFLLLPIPTLVAVALVALMEGRQGLRTFLRQIFSRQMDLKWAVIALTLGFVLHLGGSILALVTGRISAIEITAPTAFFIAYFPLARLEEIGWRGFALRRLLDRHSPFVATLMVGIPWALLHFGLFLALAPTVSAVAELLLVLTFALLLTWIYVRSGRNVFTATILHGALNAFAIVSANLPPAETLWFVFASACIGVVLLVLRDRGMWFARPEEVKVSQAVHVDM